MKANVQNLEALPRLGKTQADPAGVEAARPSSGPLAAASLALVLGIIDALLTFYLANGGWMDVSPETASLVNQSALQSALIRWVLTAVVIVAALTFGNVRLAGPVRLASVLHGIIIGYAGLILYALGLILLS